MAEFTVGEEALRRYARGRMLSWGAVLLLLGATVVLFVLGVSGDLTAYPGLSLIFVLTLLGTVAGACVSACREALHYAERQMVFILENNGVVRRRRGYPDVRISFSEIGTVSEELGWMIIRSTESRRKIAIPNSVDGYGTIRAEITKRYPLFAHTALPLKSLALLAASLLSWGAALWLRDVRGIMAAEVIAVITLAFGSYRLWVLLHRSPTRFLLWSTLGFAWLVALLVVYFRLT